MNNQSENDLRIEMITTKRKSPIHRDSSSISKSYLKKGILKKYCGNEFTGPDEHEYVSIVEGNGGMNHNDTRLHRIIIRNYNHEFPIEIEYFKETNTIKSIKTKSYYGDLCHRSYNSFYKKGGIKEYVEMTWCDEATEDDMNISGFKGDPPGGYYVRFYENGNKEREGYFEFNYSGGSPSLKYPQVPTRAEVEDMDTDQRFDHYENFDPSPYPERRDYYKSRLWLYYDENGDIKKTEDHGELGGGSLIMKFENSVSLFNDKTWDKELW